MADSAVDTATTSGTANPRACGHAITITVTIRSSAKLKLWPTRSQAMSVTVPTLIATIVSHSAARLARSCDRERDSCASRTRSITCDR